MYSDKNLAYILTILEAIEKIQLYTHSFNDPEEFYEANDQLNFNAAYNLLIVIGEESKKIESSLKKNFKEIPWRKIAGLRNHLVHEYRGVDPSNDHQQFSRIIKSDYFKHLKYLLKK